MMRLSSALLACAALGAAFSAPLSAQTNLVPNPSFESYSPCPTTSGQLNNVTSWSRPTNASSDYMNSCHTGPIVGVPSNVFGTQAARTGNGYIHLICGAPNSGDYREYAQCQLTSPLAAGVTYDVQFYVSRTDGERAVAQIGAYFSTTAISSTTSNAFNLVPQVESSTLITDTSNWVLISGSFMASGGEQYLTIGNLRNAANTTISNVGSGHNWASYYFEDVSVVARPQQGGCASELIGWADLPLPQTTGFLDVQDFENNCRAARTICRTQTPVRASLPYGGGGGRPTTRRTARFGSVMAASSRSITRAQGDSAARAARRAARLSRTARRW